MKALIFVVDEVRKQFLNAPPMAASLMLSYVADVSLDMKSLTTPLLEVGARLDLARGDHYAIEQQF